MSEEIRALDFLIDIYQQTVLINKFLDNVDYNKFDEDYMLFYAVCRALEIIGEAVKKIPNDVKNQNSVIEWSKMARLRDVLIHHYFGLDSITIWEICKNEIKPLKKQIKSILDNKINIINNPDLVELMKNKLRQIDKIK